MNDCLYISLIDPLPRLNETFSLPFERIFCWLFFVSDSSCKCRYPCLTMPPTYQSKVDMPLLDTHNQKPISHQGQGYQMRWVLPCSLISITD